MKISEIITNLLFKKGLSGQFRDFETTIEIPQENGCSIPVIIKARQLNIYILKEDPTVKYLYSQGRSDR